MVAMQSRGYVEEYDGGDAESYEGHVWVSLGGMGLVEIDSYYYDTIIFRRIKGNTYFCS